MRSYLAAGALLMIVVLQSQVHIDASGMDDTSSIPILASGKRQHNIMRFGKRPSSGHSLIHFGKRENSPTKGHSFMYFGKRSADQQDPLQSSFWDYFQKSRDGSFKRGHSIMRFGKRGDPQNSHSFIRFGRQTEDEEDENLEKRTAATGHSMLYFGKRDTNPGHSMMYFGKRDSNPGHSMMYFGKRDGANPGHAMMYFGKRDANPGHSMMYFGKRDGEDDFDKRANSGHSMMYFGKRDGEDDFDKRANGHSMMYFGKRDGDEDFEKRANSGHSMMYFGKRDLDEDKRAHSMIHFGKREEPRKGTHAMIHFGKRDSDDEEGMDDEASIDGAASDLYLDPEVKRQHNLLRFGKKMDGKGSHAMIHFGKRDDVMDEDKRAHAMIHFGKRSADDEAIAGNRSDDEKNRMKREAGPMGLVRLDEEDEVPLALDDDDSLLNQSGKMSGIFGGYPWERQDEDWEPYVEFPGKKDGGKNVFLRFG